MMQAEFEALIGKEVDCAMYSELVEPVYMYHPGITCKADIAAIYKLPRGVDILRDLLPVAEEYRRMEEEASRLRAQIARLTDKLNGIQQQLKRPLNKEG